MATNLAIDDALIVEAQRIGHFKTKKDAVTAALQQYLALAKQRRVVSMFGKVDFDPAYDYKKARSR
jgi:Arc/MetJ family transcription regulator